MCDPLHEGERLRDVRENIVRTGHVTLRLLIQTAHVSEMVDAVNVKALGQMTVSKQVLDKVTSLKLRLLRHVAQADAPGHSIAKVGIGKTDLLDCAVLVSESSQQGQNLNVVVLLSSKVLDFENSDQRGDNSCAVYSHVDVLGDVELDEVAEQPNSGSKRGGRAAIWVGLEFFDFTLHDIRYLPKHIFIGHDLVLISSTRHDFKHE